MNLFLSTIARAFSRGGSAPSAVRPGTSPALFGVKRAICGLLICAGIACQAFPPAPHHTITGLVRDELGNPITATNAEVILETTSGVRIKTSLVPNLRPGINYEIVIPMDAGLTSDPYKATALKPTVPFTMKVKIGQALYLPIEMVSDFSSLGVPAQQTRLNLTLGEDADRDGIPDAWERMLIELSGGALKGLQDVTADADYDRDGLSNLQEYLLGTYAFDPQDGFRLDIAGIQEGRPQFDLLVVRGRSYTLHASMDLKTWQPIEFRVAGGDSNAAPLSAYTAKDTRNMRFEADYSIRQSAHPAFFKALSR